MRIEVKNSYEVVKEAFWLAWQACGGTEGLGFLQDHPGATKEEVIANIAGAGDYPTNLHNRPNELYADYVFGRMMKVGFKYGDGFIEWHDQPPRRDYQAWCGKYRTTEALVQAAIASLSSKAQLAG